MKFLFKCIEHKEETPSMSVDVTRGKYCCFSCGCDGLIAENKTVTKMVIDHLKNIISYMEGYL